MPNCASAMTAGRTRIGNVIARTGTYHGTTIGARGCVTWTGNDARDASTIFAFCIVML